MTTLKGQCLCGKVQYEVEGKPLDTGYCHCRLCQRAIGAPVVAWGTTSKKTFRFTQGEPKRYASSPEAFRSFCGDCGTPLTFEYSKEPETVDFTLTSLEKPQALEPQYHIWTQSRLNWFETSDNLPRFPDRGPDHWK